MNTCQSGGPAHHATISSSGTPARKARGAARATYDSNARCVPRSRFHRRYEVTAPAMAIITGTRRVSTHASYSHQVNDVIDMCVSNRHTMFSRYTLGACDHREAPRSSSDGDGAG